MTSTEATPARPLRKDAMRNRALLLDAARQVFAERGLDASLDDIARQAGLGVGTAYRHFSNRQELIAALFDDVIDNLTVNMQAALSIANPWQALVSFFETSAIRQAQDRGLHQMLIGAVPDEQDKLRRRFTDLMGQLLDRARAAGAIRPDIAVNDAAMILAMLGVTYEIRGESSPESWRRYLTIILDGLRATERPALPVPPPSDEDFAAATAAKFKRG
jgi:AcrR family transcriptional regulator